MALLRCSIGLALVLLLGSLVAASSSNDLKWKLFKSRHGKNYADPAEDAARKSIFLENKRMIEEHNAGFGTKVHYKMALNEFSDWTRGELSRHASGVKLSSEQYEKMKSNVLDMSSPLGRWLLSDDEPIPDEVDWRKAGRVSEPTDQGKCFANWAIVTAGVLEGQQANRNFSKLVQLSAQNVLDCSESNLGCLGGEVYKAFEDMAKLGGIDDDQSYPYDGVRSECRYNKDKSVMVPTGYKLLPDNENDIKKVVARFGPVAAVMDGEANLPYYESGVYADDFYCVQDPFYARYAVLIVGYGRDKKRGDYWIIKNNWGKNWGEQGYFRMVMHENMCGIEFAALIPTF